MLCQRKEALCVPRITPELSRTAERARRWFNHSASAETAKRARLERIVSARKLALMPEAPVSCPVEAEQEKRRRAEAY